MFISKIINNFKQLVFLIILVGLTSFAFSQPYNNSWINYSQQYYKFKIAETGIYRIDSAVLANAGIPIASINPQNIQLYVRGAEIPLYIEGEGDGVFNGTDFIEFYGQHNDGWLDEPLYGSALNHPNPYYSLFNDTINYYLTWNTSTTNNRLTLEIDTNFSAYTPINYFDKKSVQFYTIGQSAGSAGFVYYDGETNFYGGLSMGYVPTEGWFDDYYLLGNNKTKSVPTSNAYLLGPNATINAVVLGESDYAGITLDQHLRVNLGSNVFDSIFAGYKKIDVQMNIPITDLGTTNTAVTFESVNDLGSSAARQTVSYIEINYPHTMDMEGLSVFDNLFLNNHPTESKSYLNFSNFNAVGNVIFYELTNGKRIDVIPNGPNYQCLAPNSIATSMECFISSDGQVKNVSLLTAINGTGTFVDYALPAIQKNTAFIIITHASLATEANDYANHRLSGPGNSSNPQNAVIFYIEDLYDQFAYGVEKHPYSIRNFLDYISANWTSKPKYLFLLGKSIKPSESRKDPINFHNNLVPSFGDPASDIMLTSGLNGTVNEPLLSTGRLAAKNGQEVTWYLSKVEQHENPTLPVTYPFGENSWMKQILHFGGGSSAGEQAQFNSFLNSYKTTIEDTLFGGNVKSYFKSSTAPIQNIISDSIMDYIGNGVAMMTFFGHASATGGFDQNIDDVALWPNQNGKYPVVLGLGCHAGDIHLSSSASTSEEYIISNNAGVIAYLSSVSLETSNSLNQFANEFYKQLAYKNYGGSIGDGIKNTIIQALSGNQYTAASAALHGDPSLVINAFDLPDYMIEASTVNFNPTVVTSDIDSFDVNVLVTNLGKAINDTIILELIRAYPGQSFPDTTYSKHFAGTNYLQTITFKLPVDVVRGLGLNTLTINVDAINAVVESFENNNSVTKTLNILSGEIIPIYPYEFMIVPDQGITLKASTAFPFEPAKNYVFEIDTTDYFNSPIKENTLINSVGGVVSWSPSLLVSIPDSTVYFWRVSKDSVDATGYNWRGRSFQYIQGKEGWQQDHFFQFENDSYQFVNHNRSLRQFQYVSDLKDIKIETHGKADWSDLNNIAFSVGGIKKGKGGVGTPTAIHVAILDSVTLEPWLSDDRNVGQANTINSFSNSEKFFIFRHNDALQMAALENFIKDTVPNGDHILMWTWYIVNLSGFTFPMPVSLRAELGNMGASAQLQGITDLYPFIFYHQKGNVASTLEMVGDSIPHKNLSVSTVLTTNANYGNIFSEILGPAVRWDSLSWRMSPLESPNTKDSTVLNVIGVDASGNETLITSINPLPTDSGDISITGRIDANIYPYLKLNTYMTDDSLLTSPQLNRWQVTYEGVPEAALEPNIYYSFQNDTVEEGIDITVSIAVKNISRYDMDSLLISFAVLNRNGNIQFLPYDRQQPLLSDSVLIATLTFSTVGLGGINSLLIDVNPNNDQLEQYHFNNVAQIPFYVNSDKVNPILDVTFDGIHILDGDIVSPKANIVMELTDENQYLILNDTADYAVYITTPDENEKRVYFYSSSGEEIMQFIPASLPRNNSKIIYQGNFPVDGGYRLRVQASDRTKNNSGGFDYIIGFEVINRSTITNIVNYPNPFTTSTRFVFTLTGSSVPDIFKIQIMTITGKVVREIHKDELGAINIGRNISDFAWDGTDTYGDRLANGLYLYRVITQINSEEIEHRGTSADFYFKKGFGKMYLFR